MNEVIVEVVKVSPIAAAIITVVVVFLKHLREERVAAQARDTQFLAAIERLADQGARRADECHRVHTKSIETIERNTASYEKLVEAHEAMQVTIAAIANRPHHGMHNN